MVNRGYLSQAHQNGTLTLIPRMLCCRPGLHVTLFYMFLQAYNYGLKAYWNHSMELSKEEGRERDSTPHWRNSILMADKAIEEARSAWIKHKEGKVDESQSMAKEALESLAKR